jgi:hypothetical protein
VVKPGNPSSMESSQRRNGKHAEHIVTIINGVFPPIYLNSKIKHGTSTGIRLARKACREGSHPPAGRSLRCMNLCPPPPRSPVGMDKGGIQIGHLDRGYLTMRKVIQDWSIRRPDRSRGYMQPYRELGSELDKNYDYERILSTSTGNSGSSGIITERISAIPSSFFVCSLRGLYLHAAWQGKEDCWEQPCFLFFFSPRASSEGFFSSCTLSNSVFVDPIKEPNKTLSKNDNNNIIYMEQ